MRLTRLASVVEINELRRGWKMGTIFYARLFPHLEHSKERRLLTLDQP